MTSANTRETAAYAQALLKNIREMAKTPIRIMEVCGTHTMAIAKSGIRELLPDTVTLLSGPGCPVCVTAESDINAACLLARLPKVILATYGDMIRVPGNNDSLALEMSNGADIRIIYSSQDALRLAAANPGYEVVLLSVGFETTAPTTAIVLETAIKEEIRNFSVLSLHKAVAPVLNFLLADPELSIDAFLLPGHISVVTGIDEFKFIADKYKKPSVVTGFEAVDILEAITMLLFQQHAGEKAIDIQYKAVRKEGNTAARNYINTYFQRVHCAWRGLGIIPFSGYALKDAYSSLKAAVRFNLKPVELPEAYCICGKIIKGQKRPQECELFGTSCTPAAPRGPCMVSEEGSCAAIYKFEYIRKGK
ncbi:MAG: hydrogenase formation protein HypD [Pelosinus sp.]|nr:hydrogenase formation protein HypD [Pelosinus sp.]